MPPKAKKTKRTLTVGCHGEQGLRDYNEDTYSTTAWKTLKSRAPLRASAACPVRCFAVYDGHGGDTCSQFCKRVFPQELKKDLEAGLPPVAALVNATYATEVAFFRAHPSEDAGSTAVCALLDPQARRVFVSNVGDSRCLLVRKAGAVVALTSDHDIYNATELRRIKAAGGSVDEDGYINEMVQTARSIGDGDAKFPDGAASHSAAVVPTPEIRVHDLAADDVALVLGCDGLFEGHGGSNAWINQMVRKLVKEGKTAKQIAAALVQQALDDGSEDNTTAVVVLF